MTNHQLSWWQEQAQPYLKTENLFCALSESFSLQDNPDSICAY